MTSARTKLFGLLLLAGIGTACSDSGPEAINLAGEWFGNSAFGGTQSPATTMDLVQNATTISGTMRVTGAFPIAGVPVTGSLDRPSRTFTWQANDGCEEWSGTLTVAADGNSMAGPILVDYSGCPSGVNDSGTLTLTRQ